MDYRKDPPQLYNTTKIPGNVWNFNRVRFKMDEYENHPTQKPEALLERIIKASSNENDLVLDSFSGPFTTCAVASRLHRKTIGIEINPDYYEIGLRRIKLVPNKLNTRSRAITSSRGNTEVIKYEVRSTK